MFAPDIQGLKSIIIVSATSLSILTSYTPLFHTFCVYLSAWLPVCPPICNYISCMWCKSYSTQDERLLTQCDKIGTPLLELIFCVILRWLAVIDNAQLLWQLVVCCSSTSIRSPYVNFCQTYMWCNNNMGIEFNRMKETHNMICIYFLLDISISILCTF